MFCSPNKGGLLCKKKTPNLVPYIRNKTRGYGKNKKASTLTAWNKSSSNRVYSSKCGGSSFFYLCTIACLPIFFFKKKKTKKIFKVFAGLICWSNKILSLTNRIFYKTFFCSGPFQLLITIIIIDFILSFYFLYLLF